MCEARFTVAALYCFARFPDFEAYQAPLTELCDQNGIKGTLLLAAEGLNGTVAGTQSGIATLIAFIEAIPALREQNIELKYSTASQMPFNRMKVRLKKEIVTMGVEGIDPLQSVGTYVQPEEWNALIDDENTILIDTRNDYEYAIGTFKGAIDPKTKTFREFPQWVEDHRGDLEGKKIAMFCTGGIRCEKATAFVKGLGFDDVYHLKGGILKYLEDMPAEDTRWEGECFVFDERVSVGHGLVEGDVQLCRACRNPVTPEGKLSQFYEEGISCDSCYHERSDADRARYAERQRQVLLAKERGAKQHIGD
ncbi:rhodanese-related sulfurtransferase [Bacillus subtilis]|uniref:oxygen-dependent tRNA uridine(34) hydroxylase TrhO n=1 Tax=Pseudochrobactrum asaccharolyticum TaxID=354351 RepID=UPI001F2E4FFC|nr:rhodanese-related sulfurtransferase [Pseudochrobactrum asaccharolyticum]MCF7647159.1 rhodanese-related sulfurtransferase [Pseudochrobactrum asaccharolyticum]MCF7673425.1 rhodanese-related sulfurtransferase [Bacillus subtilis]